ncbi:MAG: hypothetical protein M1813_007522 [Trichoglossum hirsutum]|nr:MAG: hypothetical protein M1813_007522 [Trichoglossum hirsutum]
MHVLLIAGWERNWFFRGGAYGLTPLDGSTAYLSAHILGITRGIWRVPNTNFCIKMRGNKRGDNFDYHGFDYRGQIIENCIVLYDKAVKVVTASHDGAFRALAINMADTYLPSSARVLVKSEPCGSAMAAVVSLHDKTAAELADELLRTGAATPTSEGTGGWDTPLSSPAEDEAPGWREGVVGCRDVTAKPTREVELDAGSPSEPAIPQAAGPTPAVELPPLAEEASEEAQVAPPQPPPRRLTRRRQWPKRGLVPSAVEAFEGRRTFAPIEPVLAAPLEEPTPTAAAQPASPTNPSGVSSLLSPRACEHLDPYLASYAYHGTAVA